MSELQLRLMVRGVLAAAVLLVVVGATTDGIGLVVTGAALLLVATLVELIWRP
ncbi:hypothetical protein [Streptomyces sp. NPDC060194]|uniref:hypothetical protein n=1 Tax=Streptomyces sp. NPDC060194 TaxID=3347069 RepID=UPI003646BA09